MCLALGAILIQDKSPTFLAVVWYIGATLGLLGIIIPVIGKTIK